MSRSDFDSHKIISNKLAVLSFWMARLTYGSFFSFCKNAALKIASMIWINNVSTLWPTV